MSRAFTSLPLLVLFVLPLGASIALMAPLFLDARAFQALFAHPQFWGALRLSLGTGIVSTVVALALAIVIIANTRRDLVKDSGPLLAIPHLAFAIGLVFVIAPTGLVARLIATLITGGDQPPQWIAAQDPYGISLTLALILKEVPFLVWAMANFLDRDDLRHVLQAQVCVAKSLGHGPRSTWLKVLLPQLLPRMVWPLIAVFAYGTTVVDMALVTGPTQPPTLATVIWRDLNDGEAAMNARGAAGVLMLSGVILCLLLVVGLLLRLGGSRIRGFYSRYPAPENSPMTFLGQIWGLLRLSYLMVGVLLLLQSFSGQWPFPNLLATHFTLAGWQQLIGNFSPLLSTLAHATLASLAALIACIAWLEWQNPDHDRYVLWAAGLALCLPSLVIGLGQYRLFLMLGLTGTQLAVFLAHVLPVTAYVFIMLHGPYRAFDQRWQATAAGLMVNRQRFLREVKWPMLGPSLWAAAGIGFAVAVAQFVPVQLAASGRHATLAMEAVTLSSGGNRALMAASALALMVLPLLGFALSARLGRSRWSG